MFILLINYTLIPAVGTEIYNAIKRKKEKVPRAMLMKMYPIRKMKVAIALIEEVFLYFGLAHY